MYYIPILLTVGAIPLLSNFSWNDLFRKVVKWNFKEYLERWIYKLQQITKPKSLKNKLRQLDRENKDNFISKSYKTMSSILVLTGESRKLRQMNLISAICGLLGVLIALRLQSFLLLPILGGGFALLPMWLMKFKAFHFHKQISSELSVVLSMITNSYIRNENIMNAVEENLHFMNSPIKDHFEWFLYQYRNISADTSLNLMKLKSRIDDKVFSLWIDTLIMCQKDINQKYSLNAIVEQYTTERELLNILSAEITKPIREYVGLICFSLLAFPLLAVVSSSLGVVGVFDVLFKGVFGQAIIVGYVLSVFYGVNIAIDLSTKI